jgi:hypothetical protein
MSDADFLADMIAFDKNGYRRGWLDCQEQVLKITKDHTGQGVLIYTLVKKLECPL